MSGFASFVRATLMASCNSCAMSGNASRMYVKKEMMVTSLALA